jgi:large subunit ribosomal protein L25
LRYLRRKSASTFSAEEKAFKNLVYTPNAHTVVIDLDGKKFNAVLQDIQVHPVSDKILHIDFFQLMMTRKSLWKFL